MINELLSQFQFASVTFHLLLSAVHKEWPHILRLSHRGRRRGKRQLGKEKGPAGIGDRPPMQQWVRMPPLQLSYTFVHMSL